MNDEKLIELVRHCPALYDVCHIKYMDYTAKQNIWDKISKDMKVDASTCKKRWNHIRDTYHKSLKRNRTKGEDQQKHKLYKYSKGLEFLKKHLTEKNPKKTIQTEIREQIDEQNENETINCETNSERDSNLSHDSQEANNLPNLFNSTNKQMFEHIEIRVDDEVPGVEEIQKHNLSQNKDFQFAATEKHSVDVFLAYISNTLKSLDPYRLNLAKSEIFATAQKYEMQMILNQFPEQSTTQLNSPEHRRNSNPHSSFKPFIITPVILPESIESHDSKNS
ncbi:uncharacterized protein [Diabrotica undecimpunctata]|uniref:uncharacterized protein n=1 Tax=Diabrotica undecimpunctata TaxID=50387 RepID=UPI003B63F7AD